MAKDLSDRKVGVIGLGKMGSALAEALLNAGVSTTAWNRTKGKSDVIAAAGAAISDSPAALAEASDIVIVCVSDHAAASEVLVEADVERALKGRILCQLGVVTADQSRETARWAEEHHVGYLEASILGVPTTVREQGAMLVCSGPKELFEQCADTLSAFGSSVLVSENRGAAYDFDKAVYSFAYSVMQGFIHGMALAYANGIALDAFSQVIIRRLPVWPERLQAITDAIEARSHPAVDCAITVWADAFAKNLELSRGSGVDDGLPSAIMENFEKAVAAGHGDDDFSALFEVMIPR